MVYSAQSGQTCSICQQPPHVGKISKTSTQSGDFTVTVGKVLSACGHAFHSECINRSIHSHNNKCPNCRAEIVDEDRSFNWMKDPIQTEGFESHISNKEGVNGTFIAANDISEEIKDYVLTNVDKLAAGVPVPGFSLVEKQSFSFSMK